MQFMQNPVKVSDVRSKYLFAMSALKSSQHWFETCAEDYWNDSTTTAFSFDDENALTEIASTELQKATIAPVPSDSVGDVVTTGISDHLHFKLDDKDAERQLQKCLNSSFHVQRESRTAPNSPQSAVIDLVKGTEVSLQQFKSRNDKISLLDTAIGIGDGNAITVVIRFLRNTLSKRIFNQEISKRPIAINHLISYLQRTDKLNEAIDFLTYLGLHNEIALIKLSQCLKTKNTDAKIRQLRHCRDNYFKGIDNELSFWGNFIDEHIDLLELQQPIEIEDSRRESLPECNQKFIDIPRHSILNMSVVETLFYCCLYHYELSENNFASPRNICKRYSLTEKQFTWTALRSLCVANKWPEVDALFQYKSWLGGRKLKSPIPIKKVVKLLHRHEAPVDLVEKYLKQVEDNETKMNLAITFKFHKFVVELCATLRDRKTLQDYVLKLHPQTDEYITAQNYLRNSNIKWKN